MSQTTYDVVLLVEQALSSVDAAQVTGLHTEAAEPVRYHVLHPVEDAAARVEAALGSIAGSEVMAAPGPVMDRDDLAAVQEQMSQEARSTVETSVARLRDTGADVTGTAVPDDPVDALVAVVAQVNAAEVIVLTRSHVIAEFFHLDWTSRARRRLGVPVLHLLEHESFDEQAGSGEGVTGL